MKCKPRIRHFQPPKLEFFSSQCALHGLRALDFFGPHLISWADILHFWHCLPSFIVKNAPILQPTNCGCKFVFLFSSFSLLLPFSALFFLFFLCFYKSQSLKTAHQLRRTRLFRIKLKTFRAQFRSADVPP